MAASFYFYDLETSGFNPRAARIMQFAGQRTDMGLEPVGKPDNFLIKLTPDVLPDPGAILVTGITPQKTLEEGLTEAEFLEHFYKNIWQPGTIFVGYNSVRFDDEFMRFLMWRNFYDSYEWQWKDNSSRWDLLDVVRMTRALRPDGINWPFDSAQGKPTNRLELLTKANKIDHTGAHDALADVKATIAVAKLIKQKQPKLFDWLLSCRDKRSVERLVGSGQPFVYTSGKYPGEFGKTTVAIKLADTTGGALVYDLRHDPSEFVQMDPGQLAERWQFTKDEDAPARLPIKTLKYNRCPAVAPLGVLEENDGWNRVNLSLKAVEANKKKLAEAGGFIDKVKRALDQLDEDRDKKRAAGMTEAEAQLYDGFISDADRAELTHARSADTKPNFGDERLAKMWPRFKARNYPKNLSAEEMVAWENYCKTKLTNGGEASPLAQYFQKLAALKSAGLDGDKEFLLEELQLYGESIIPIDAGE